MKHGDIPDVYYNHNAESKFIQLDKIQLQSTWFHSNHVLH